MNSGAKVGIIATGVAALLLLIIIVGFNEARPRSFRAAEGTPVVREDSATDYVILCKKMLSPIKLVDGVEPSPAEQAVATRRMESELYRIASQGLNLGVIAQSLLAESANSDQILTNLPNARALFSGAGEMMSGLNAGSNGAAWSGFQKAGPELLRALDTFEKITEAVNFQHGLAIQLANLAPKFSGPLTTNAAMSHDFIQHQPGWLQSQTRQSLSLSNLSGTTLHDCVILVRLADADGKSHLNVHFAPLWPNNEQLLASYQESDPFTKALPNVSRVEIAVCARELTFKPILLRKQTGGWAQLD